MKKRIWIATVLVIIVVALWSTHLMGQSSIPAWKPVIGVPQEIEALVDEVAGLTTRMEAVEGSVDPGLKARVDALELQVASLEADIALHRDGILTASMQARDRLISSIAYTTYKVSQSEEYTPTVSDSDAPTGRSQIPGDESIANSNAALTALQAYIALLQAE